MLVRGGTFSVWLTLFLQICKIMSGGVPSGPPWYQIQDRWCLPCFARGDLSILFLIILLRLVIPLWMTSSPSSKRRNLMLFRFPFYVSYFSSWKADLRAFEDMWSRKLGIKTNLKNGMFRISHSLFLVPDPSQLSEPFKEDIIQRIEQNAPALRQILKITDKDSCKFSFGYVFLVFHSELGTLCGSFTGSTAILSVIS